MDSKDISFTTTAMCRPKLFNKTLESFCNNLKGLNFEEITIFINVDPLPLEEGVEIVSVQKNTVEVAKKYFGNVVSRLPGRANFTSAVKWCWQSAKTKYIFHLEDDWVLKEEVDIDILSKPLIRDERIIQSILRAYKYQYDKPVLSPSLISERFYKQVYPHFNKNINPEIQLRSSNKNLSHIKWNNMKVIAYPFKEIRIAVKDTGRKWIKEKKYKKPKSKSDFTSWVEKENE